MIHEKEKVALIRVLSYDPVKVEEGVRQALDLIGGIGKFVRPGERILLKPNLLSPKPPERAITTHPEVIRAMIRLVKEAGATPFLGDSPMGAVDRSAPERKLLPIETFWEKTGVKRICGEEGCELVSFEREGAVEFPGNHKLTPRIFISKAALSFDGVINLPKLKTHGMMLLTAAIKNLYGCVPGIRKTEYHKQAITPRSFSHLLLDIYNRVSPRFSLIDGIEAMDGDGPSSGRKIAPGVLISGSSGTSVDAVAAAILGFDPGEIQYLKEARKQGMGEIDLENIEIAGERLDDVRVKDPVKPSNAHLNFIPQFLADIVGKFVWARPVVDTDKCRLCRKCVTHCPVEAIRMVPEKNCLDIDYKKCIRCLCCHESCEWNSITMEYSWLARRVIR
ncbi:MAG TPA: DUF362 domain-containing protein [bacterium]|nr:DUF362 domain-containing protein [bacterium]